MDTEKRIKELDGLLQRVTRDKKKRRGSIDSSFPPAWPGYFESNSINRSPWTCPSAIGPKMDEIDERIFLQEVKY